MALTVIFPALAVLFLALAGLRIVRDRSCAHPQTRTWLMIGVIFGIVSTWLSYQR
jgi:hypothetical protein